MAAEQPGRRDAAPAHERSGDAAQFADTPIYVATSNLGKLHEMRALFACRGFDVRTYAGYSSPLEGERSYAENAELKGHALRRIMLADGRAEAVLADDSGLEVRALDGRPGVLTADYGGASASWPERRARLLHDLSAGGRADRRARFVCAMHFIDAQGREFAALGTVDGQIAPKERGELGFSFDPIFLYPPAEKTFAELSDDQKNRVSHRAIAAAAIVAAIKAAGVGLPELAARPLRGTEAGERE